MPDSLQLLKTKNVVLLDGAMGTELDKPVFDMEPALFAEGVAECVRQGARIVGGCCGTTPAHIEAVVRRGGFETRPHN